MAAISKKLHSVEGGRLMFWCPGCDVAHQVVVEPPAGWTGPCWGYNGNPDAPTFTPSILARWTEWHPPATAENTDAIRRGEIIQEPVNKVCHSFVTDGKIQFLTDCTHALAGQTVDIPDFDKE